MRGRIIRIVAGAALTIALSATADSIKVGDTLYENVYVAEGGSNYYVSIPEDGRVLNVPKSEVDPSTVVKTQDQVQRAALLEKWKEKSRGRNTPSTQSLPAVAPELSGKPILLDPPAPKEVKKSRSQVITPEMQELQALRRQRQAVVDAERRARESAKDKALMQRKLYTSQDTPKGGNQGMGRGGYGNNNNFGGYGNNFNYNRRR